MKITKTRAGANQNYKSFSQASRRKAKLGTGARFDALEKSLEAKGNVRNPAAVAASIGRKKFGKAKFQKLAAKGRKNA